MTPAENADLETLQLAREAGAGLMGRVESFLGRFIAYPSEHARVAHTLWCAHTHLMASWHTTPRMGFLSAEKASGKTRALEVTELLVPDPVLSISMSPAAITRKVATGNATILFDEVDALFGTAGREENNVDVRSILNGGYRRGAKVHRCVVRGKAVELEELDAFAPVALAGLRSLPDTLASRSIIIRMQRRAPDEGIESFRRRKVEPEADALRGALADWCASLADDVADAEPVMPSGIVDRAAECWEPLFAVADAAGGDWPKRARAAAKHLIAGSTDESLTPGVELLAHIREAFGADEALSSDALLERLRERPESPWADIRGKPLDQRGLAVRLRPYGIHPRVIRYNARTPRGYRAEQFADVWRRYLSHPQQAQQAQQLSHCNNLDVADVADVADKPEKGSEHEWTNHETASGPERGQPAGERLARLGGEWVSDERDIEKRDVRLLPRQQHDPADAFEERAAVLQYDAGLDRAEAERDRHAPAGHTRVLEADEMTDVASRELKRPSLLNAPRTAERFQIGRRRPE